MRTTEGQSGGYRNNQDLIWPVGLVTTLKQDEEKDDGLIPSVKADINVEQAETPSSRRCQALSYVSGAGGVGYGGGVIAVQFAGVAGTSFAAVVALPFAGAFGTGALFSLAMLARIRAEKDHKKRRELQEIASRRSKWAFAAGAVMAAAGACLIAGSCGMLALPGVLLMLCGSGLMGSSYGLGAVSAYDTVRRGEKKENKNAYRALPKAKSRRIRIISIREEKNDIPPPDSKSFTSNAVPQL